MRHGIQERLLENAARLVKPGGVLIYSTCTMEPEENGELIGRFLDNHPEFTIDNARKFVSPEVVNSRGWIETFPGIHGIDGSVAVRLVRKT